MKIANPAICRMLGYTEEELRTMDVAAIHPKEDLQRVMAEFEAQVRGDKKLAPDMPCLRKDGSIVYADINGVSITLGGRKYNAGFFRNITERKLAEEKISQSYQKLQKMLESAVEAIAAISETRDPYTAGHQVRVTVLTCAIAAEMGFSAETIADIRVGGILHDIGKIYVPA